MSDSGTPGEKSFAPTERKLEEARRRGEVAKSTDAAAAAAYLGLVAAAFGTGATALAGTAAGLAGFIGRADRLEGVLLGAPGGAEGGGALALGLALGAGRPLLPFLLLPAGAALAAYLAQRAFVIAPGKLLPKLERIDPVTLAGQKFGPTGLVEFAKGVLKMAAIGTVLWLWLAAGLDATVGLLALPPVAAQAELLGTLAGLLAAIAAIAVVIAAADLLWQRFDHARRLRMSFQELREEQKESEGDPYRKAERRRRAEAIARNRMLADVVRADVVIVNPAHYAVALGWTRAPGSAPHCLAKGVDETALAIRARAEAAGIPVREDAATARALHATVEIGAEVPPDLYRAVAAAIRFAETMRARARAGWRGVPPGGREPGR